MALYGLAVLDPQHVDWLLHGDPAQHLLGLAYFVSEPWQWPPGRLLGFGGETSVVFTDSIPLLALLLKLLGWPVPWQPFGLWMLLCHTAAAALSALWMHRQGAQPVASVSAGLLLAFAPMLLLRVYGHEALMAHFLLPWALLLAGRPWSAPAWTVLLVCALGIHPYWFVMVGAWALAVFLYAGWQGQRAVAALLLHAVVMGIALLMAGWLLGYTQGDADISSVGFGYFSANLLTWFDPMDWSGFLAHHGRDPGLGRPWSLLWPSIGQSTHGQYEGFAWLGAGGLAVVAMALVLRTKGVGVSCVARAPSAQQQPYPWVPLWVAAVALMVLAWSHQWGLGTMSLVEWPLPRPWLDVLGTFRASGRFIWPITWLLLLSACLVVGRQQSTAWLLVLAVALQAYDLSAKGQELGSRMRHGVPGAQSPISDEAIGNVFRHCPQLHLLALQPQASEHWIPLAWLAVQRGATVWPAPTARLTHQRQVQLEQGLIMLVSGSGWATETVYVTWSGALPEAKYLTIRQAWQLSQPEGAALQHGPYEFWLPPACTQQGIGG